eukprot:Hpha_TRINITY_DN14370_c0_g2::TRINITY_DN14370_c0_g2_i1::g.87148::m.87148/K06678/YCG1, CAPG; condensin complex subunit 3
MPRAGRSKEDAVQSTLRRILSGAAQSLVGHTRLRKELGKLEAAQGSDEVTQALGRAADVFLACQDGQVSSRAFRFLAQYVASRDNPAAHRIALLGSAGRWMCHKDKFARRGACELVSTIFGEMSRGQDFTEEEDVLIDNLINLLHDRLDDKDPSVRCAAVGVLKHLQNPVSCDRGVPRGGRCDVIQHLLQLLAHDAQGTVRAAVVKALAWCYGTKRALVSCLDDKDTAVRREAFLRLHGINPTDLNVQDRTRAVRTGLRERTALVREHAAALVGKWLVAVEGNPVQLLGLVLPQADVREYVAGEVYRRLYRRPRLDEETDLDTWDEAQAQQLLPADHKAIRPEAALMLRVIVQRLQDEESPRADIYLPPLDKVRDAVKNWAQAADAGQGMWTEVVDELLQLCLCYDCEQFTQEERKLYGSMVGALLGSLRHPSEPELFVKSGQAVLRHLCKHVPAQYDSRLNLVLGLLRKQLKRLSGDTTWDESDAAEFFDLDATADAEAACRRELSNTDARIEALAREGKARQEAGRRELDKLHFKREELNGRLHELYAYWIRILAITAESLSGCERGEEVDLTHATLAVAALQLEAGSQRRFRMAVRVIAICSVIDAAFASTHARVFLHVLEKKKKFGPPVMEAALSALFDICLEHGTRAAEPEDSSPTQTQGSVGEGTTERPGNVRIIDTLLQFLAHGDCHWEDEEGWVGSRKEEWERRRALQSVAVVGFTKLLVVNRLPAEDRSVVLAQLLLYYFDPTNASSRQCALSGLEAKDGDDPARAAEGREDPVWAAMQHLAVFFTGFGSSSAERQSIIMQASVCALRHFLRESASVLPAEGMKPLSSLNPEESGKRRKGQHLGLVEAFLRNVACFTDVKDLRSISRRLADGGLLRDGSEDREADVEYDAASRAASRQIVCPRRTSTHQRELLRGLGEMSLHETLAMHILLDVGFELGAKTEMGKERARAMLRGLRWLRYYDRERLGRVRKLVALCNELRGSGDKVTETAVGRVQAAAVAFINESGGNVDLTTEEEEELEKEREEHRKEWERIDSIVCPRESQEESARGSLDTPLEPRRPAAGAGDLTPPATPITPQTIGSPATIVDDDDDSDDPFAFPASQTEVTPEPAAPKKRKGRSATGGAKRARK